MEVFLKCTLYAKAQKVQEEEEAYVRGYYSVVLSEKKKNVCNSL